MAVTEKVSVAMGQEELRLAKLAAEREGVSLSAFVTDAVRARLAEQRRAEAARTVLAAFSAEDLPTANEQRELLALWLRPQPSDKAVSARRQKRR